MTDPRIAALAEGADDRRKIPGVPDDLDELRVRMSKTSGHPIVFDLTVSDLAGKIVEAAREFQCPRHPGAFCSDGITTAVAMVCHEYGLPTRGQTAALRGDPR